MQDVSNIKRIGKLTIDQDKLLGNGSGGTFVFEGKWNVSTGISELSQTHLNSFLGSRCGYQAHASPILWAG
jgi:hypothetical protein